MSSSRRRGTLSLSTSSGTRRDPKTTVNRFAARKAITVQNTAEVQASGSRKEQNSIRAGPQCRARWQLQGQTGSGCPHWTASPPLGGSSCTRRHRTRGECRIASPRPRRY
eukprot:941655-Prymnesium_polylepis.2